jgi:translation initiation factor 3 subunit F
MALFLNHHEGLRSTTSCAVHPVVVFSILDHYMRRPDGQHRVIGTLLGKERDGKVELSNCFPLPHTENEGEVHLDEVNFNTMLAMHNKVNPNETIVGWYSTGDSLSFTTQLIHDFYRKHIPSPVHLLVDTNLTSERASNARLNTKAFVSSSVTVNQDSEIGYQFLEIQQDTVTFDSEDSGVQFLVRETGVNEGRPLVTQIQNLEFSIQRLLENLDVAQQYVDDVIAGKQVGNPKLGKFLTETLNAIPMINPAMFETVFNNNLQDNLMVMYLSNLTRTQLALSEKLSAVV